MILLFWKILILLEILKQIYDENIFFYLRRLSWNLEVRILKFKNKNWQKKWR